MDLNYLQWKGPKIFRLKIRWNLVRLIGMAPVKSKCEFGCSFNQNLHKLMNSFVSISIIDFSLPARKKHFFCLSQFQIFVLLKFKPSHDNTHK